MGWVKTENVLPHSQKLFLLHLLFLRGWKVFILMWGSAQWAKYLKIVSSNIFAANHFSYKFFSNKLQFTKIHFDMRYFRADFAHCAVF